jgi:hypothetical protein
MRIMNCSGHPTIDVSGRKRNKRTYVTNAIMQVITRESMAEEFFYDFSDSQCGLCRIG